MAKETVTKKAWLAFSLIIIFYAYQYIFRVMPNILFPFLQNKLRMSGSIYGQFSGIYYIGYALAHISAGYLITRFGMPFFLPLSIALTAMGNLPILYSDSWSFILFGRFLIGVGSSFAPIALFYLLNIFFPARLFTRLLSVMVSIGLLAAIYAGAPLNYLFTKFGVEKTLLSLIALGLFIMVSSAIFLPKKREKNTIKLSDFKSLFFNKKLMLAALAGGLLVGTLEGFPDAWGITLLSMKFHITSSHSAQMTSYIFLGMLIGSPFFSLIGSNARTALKTIIICGLVMSTSFITILLAPHTTSPLFISVLLFFMGICCGYQMPALFYSTTLVSNEISPLSSTVFNMIVMIFGHVLHTIIGILIDYFGHVTNLHAVEKSLYTVPVAAFLGSLIFLSLYWQKKR